MRNFTLSLAFTAALVSTTASGQPAPAGLLPIDEAYQVTADAKSPGSITVHWKIADGYYLYREQMKFSAGKDTVLGEAKLPDGVKFHDEFSGDVQIYHNTVDASIPFTSAAGATSVQLTVGYQGCHEVEPKLCYPPHKKTFTLAIAVGASSAPTNAAAPPSPSAARTGADRYKGTPEAQAVLQQAETARKAGKIEDAIKGYKKAIDLDPDYAKANFQYVLYERSHNTMAVMLDFARAAKMSPEERRQSELKTRAQDKLNEKALIDHYTAKLKEHPDQAIYPWALGLIYNESDLAKTQTYCEQAIKIDPKFAPAYECLSNVVGIRESAAAALDYQRKAFELAPDDEEIAGIYAYMLGENGNADASQIQALLQRFPDSFVIAMTLVDQANAQQPDSARIAALEQLRKDAPAASKPVASLAAEHLYAIYIDSDLAKAKALVAQNAAAESKNPQWTGRLAYVDALIKAKSEIAAGKATAALATLKTVEAQKDQAPDKQWYLVQAEALDASKRTADAINLLEENFATSPSDSVLQALNTYGAKIGKTPAQIGEGVWAAFAKKATPSKELKLKRLDNGQTVSLDDYKGKPVIVDFWYPNCGPCRASFPYLQKIAAKYKDKGLTVLAVSSIEEQQPFAQPYLLQKKYDFVGLAGSEEFAQNVWEVQGYPTTFLLGADGRTYMKPTIYDEAHQRSTELAVEQLLAHKQ